MSREKLLELAARCESASGPDRELDAMIRRAVFSDFVICGDEGSTCSACMMGVDCTQVPECGAPLGMVDERTSHPSRWQDDERLPLYTASLDAAMTLAPDDPWIEIKGPRKYLNIPTPVPNTWSASVSKWNHEGQATGWGYNAARALTAACLRARASLTGEKA